jgi:hypothetical protein
MKNRLTCGQGGMRNYTRDRTKRRGRGQRTIQSREPIVYVRKVCPSSTVYHCLCWCSLPVCPSVVVVFRPSSKYLSAQALSVVCPITVRRVSNHCLLCFQRLCVVCPTTVCCVSNVATVVSPASRLLCPV